MKFKGFDIPTPDWVSACGTCALYHGDARRLLPAFPSASIDFVFTDPPYGHNNNNNGDLIHRIEAAIPARRSRSSALLGTNKAELARPIANDGAEANDLIRWAFAEFDRLLSGGGCCCCCCGGGGPDPQFARWSLWLDEALGFKQMVVWDKGPMGMGWHYRRSYETVLVGEKRGAACRWFAESDDIENILRPGAYGIRKIIPSADEHPTPKPVELACHFVKLHSLPGDLVLDPFCGRASTGVACVATRRLFIGVEIDRHWFERAVERLSEALSRPLFDLEKEKQGELFT